MKDARLIHLEYEGTSTRVFLETPLTVKPKLTNFTSRGMVVSVPITKGINKHLDPKLLTPQALIESDPELNWEAGGRILAMETLTTAYFDPDREDPSPISDFQFYEIIYDSQGNPIDRRPKLNRSANLDSPMPLKLGKKMPIQQVLTSFIFRHTHQLVHKDGVTMDFLYRIAQDLDQSQSMAVIGGGPKGNQPLVMREKGSPYRGFLYGEVSRVPGEKKYKLLLLLSPQEMKLPETEDDRPE